MKKLFKKGDKVKIVGPSNRKDPHFSCWIPGMEQYLNKTLTITGSFKHYDKNGFSVWIDVKETVLAFKTTWIASGKKKIG